MNNWHVQKIAESTGGRSRGQLELPLGEISLFDSIISIENLFLAWERFRKGKRSKPDVQVFERNLEINIFELHAKLSLGYIFTRRTSHLLLMIPNDVRYIKQLYVIEWFTKLFFN